MEPEAQLIASQAMQELARQQATGQVDEVLRGQIVQQVLGGAAQQAKAREAQQQAADFQRMKQLGDVVAKGEMESRLRGYQRGTERLSGGLQAATGALSAGAGMFADYLGQQEGLKKGLQAAEAKGGVQGAIDFLNANPDYDPGEETLQRLYAGSEMGQQDAFDLADALEAQQVRTRGELTKARTNRLFDRDIENLQAFENAQARFARSQDEAALARADQAAFQEFRRLAAQEEGMEALRRLQQEVADDMAMVALKRSDRENFRQSQANQIAVDALNRDADRFLLSQELQNFAPERTTFSPTLGDVDATPVMNMMYSGESKILPFTAATRSLGDPTRLSPREQRLFRLARERAAAEERARIVADESRFGSVVPRRQQFADPTLKERLKLLEALGL